MKQFVNVFRYLSLPVFVILLFSAAGLAYRQIFIPGVKVPDPKTFFTADGEPERCRFSASCEVSTGKIKTQEWHTSKKPILFSRRAMEPGEIVSKESIEIKNVCQCKSGTAFVLSSKYNIVGLEIKNPVCKNQSFSAIHFIHLPK